MQRRRSDRQRLQHRRRAIHFEKVNQQFHLVRELLLLLLLLIVVVIIDEVIVGRHWR